jgi:hypothetical protein
MKIFLTEIEAYGKTFQGPNIVAETLEKAEQAAQNNYLVIVGELDSIYVNGNDETHLNLIDKNPSGRTVH